MPNVTPKRSFLLRIEDGQRIRAKKGQKIEVTDEEHKRLDGYFKEPYSAKKKGLSVK